MKKILIIFAMIGIIFAPFALANNAFAATTCPIGYTGPNSDNLCVSETSFECEINTETHVVIVDNNEQNVVSGVILSNGNTGTGTGTSGSANTNNLVTYIITVNDDEGRGCTATPVVDPVTTPTSVGTVAVVTPTVLPNTSNGSLTTSLVTIGSILGLSAFVSGLAVALYRNK